MWNRQDGIEAESEDARIGMVGIRVYKWETPAEILAMSDIQLANGSIVQSEHDAIHAAVGKAIESKHEEYPEEPQNWFFCTD